MISLCCRRPNKCCCCFCCIQTITETKQIPTRPIFIVRILYANVNYFLLSLELLISLSLCLTLSFSFPLPLSLNLSKNYRFHSLAIRIWVSISIASVSIVSRWKILPKMQRYVKSYKYLSRNVGRNGARASDGMNERNIRSFKSCSKLSFISFKIVYAASIVTAAIKHFLYLYLCCHRHFVSHLESTNAFYFILFLFWLLSNHQNFSLAQHFFACRNFKAWNSSYSQFDVCSVSQANESSKWRTKKNVHMKFHFCSSEV